MSAGRPERNQKRQRGQRAATGQSRLLAQINCTYCICDRRGPEQLRARSEPVPAGAQHWTGMLINLLVKNMTVIAHLSAT